MQKFAIKTIIRKIKRIREKLCTTLSGCKTLRLTPIEQIVGIKMELFQILMIGLIILLISVGLFWKRKGYPPNYPPGPGYISLPVLGHMPYLGQAPFRTLMKWKEKLGPIVSFDFASFPTVAISDAKLIREAMADSRFSGRPDLPVFKDRSGGERHGIIFSDGEEWSEIRRFTVRHLRDFGFGTKSMDSIIYEEAIALIERLKAASSQPLRLREHLNTTVFNSIWNIIASERLDHRDTKVLHLFSLLTQTTTGKNPLVAIAGFVPWMANYFPHISGYSRFLRNIGQFQKFLRDALNSHRATIVHGQPRDLMDAFIEEAQTCTNPNSAFYGSVGEQIILTSFLDLFMAGTETTTTTLSFFGMYMAAFPEIQEKLYSEILTVIGSSRLPEIADKSKMPYMEAVSMETLRYSSIAPFAGFHNTLADAELGGYAIPKNTMILTNLYSCHHDRHYWTDPELFKPERFLAADGKTILKHEAFLAFSSGKRVCLGENLARSEIFIFGAAIIQRFKLTFDPENTPTSLDPKIGWVLSPPPHHLIFTEHSQ